MLSFGKNIPVQIGLIMTTKFNSQKYKFADSVEITGTAQGGYDESQERYRRVFRNDFIEGKSMKGRIVGIGRIMIGHTQSDYYDYSDSSISGSRSCNIFIPKGMVFGWKVVLAMTRKTVLCLPDQIRPIDEEVEIPIGISRPWTEGEKDEMREIMKEAPRDNKGRWIKNNQLANV